jgi:hypothetical protein
MNIGTVGMQQVEFNLGLYQANITLPVYKELSSNFIIFHKDGST